MGTIVKSHTFSANQILDASSLNQNFDQLFDIVNGGLDSANLSGNLTFAASNIGINDPDGWISATQLEAALPEFLPRGYNDIHILGKQSSGFSVFPGRIEINGTINIVNARLNVTAATPASGTFSQSTVYAVTFQPGVSGVITATDIRIHAISTISATDGINVGKNGFYFSSNQRIVTTLINGCGNCQSLYDYMTLDTPWKGHSYVLNVCEALQLGFSISTTTTYVETHLETSDTDASNPASGGVIMNVCREFDPTQNRYNYVIQAFNQDNTSLWLCQRSGLNPGSNYHDLWNVDVVYFRISDDSREAVTVSILAINSTTLPVRFELGAGDMRIHALTGGHNGQAVNYILKRRPGIDRVNIR